jgi:hypothetical protein
MKFRYFYHYGFYSNYWRHGPYDEIMNRYMMVPSDPDERVWNFTETMFEISKEDYEQIRELEKKIIAKEGREHHRPRRYTVIPKGKTIVKRCKTSKGMFFIRVPDGTGPLCAPSSPPTLVRHSYH